MNDPNASIGGWSQLTYNGLASDIGAYEYVSGGPDTTPPSVPTGLTAAAISSSQINLSWTASTDNVGITGYRIYRCTGSGCTPSTQIGTATTNSYSDTGLSPSTTYNYTIAAYDAAGNVSAQSTSASATTQPADTTAPTISSVVAGSITQSTATITWTTNEASDSQVEYGLTTSYGSQTTLNASMVTSHSQSLSGLTSGTTYHYRVKSKDAAGNLAFSGDYSFTTTAPDTQAPTVPTNLSATAISSSQINLAWTASTDNVGVTGYRIYRNSTQVGTSATNSYSDTGLSPSTTYTYTVAAYDAVPSVSAQSSSASATTSATPPPSGGLVAGYSFNEGSGTTAADSSGNNNNGTISGATWTASGRYGNALSFANYAVVTINDSSSLDSLTTNFTIEAWAKRSAINGYDWIYLSGAAANNWMFGFVNSNYLTISDTYFNNTPVADTNWHYVAAVKNGNSGTNLTFYLDGVAAGTASVGSFTTPSGNKYIGSNPSGSPFDGLIDEVRIYNRVLSQSEIQTDMNTPIGTTDTTPPAAPTGVTIQ